MPLLRLFKFDGRAVAIAAFGDAGPLRVWVWSGTPGAMDWSEASALVDEVIEGHWLSAAKFNAEFPGVPLPSTAMLGGPANVVWL